MKHKAPAEEYVEKAKLLSAEDIDRLSARMRGRFSRRVEDKKLSTIDALALQLEYEDQELAEWRDRMAEIRKKNGE